MNTALCFNEVLPYDGRQKPVSYRNGKYYLTLMEKGAKQVGIVIDEVCYDLKNIGQDLWEIELPDKDPIKYLQVVVDGRQTVEAVLPITYGYSRPYNFVELPVSDSGICDIRDVEHGSIRREFFFSKVTGEWESCMVYTPSDYDKEPDKVFPVLYLQHGHGENETGWTSSGRVNFIMDNLISEKKAMPFVIVMNNGMVQKKTKKGDHIVDHLLFEPMLLEDVIPFIEGKYHAGGSKEKRGIAGLSMGSMQASMISMRHPELFSEVGIFSGFLRDWISSSELDMSGHEPSDNSHLEALKDSEAFNGYFNTFFRGIGKEDPFMEHFTGDDEILKENGISNVRRIYEGTHDWNVWRRCFYDFAQLIFR
ncbi:MAG: enterochelin esterase [Butyrivibrio sp.]|nr:enterochelin esterase [Butyrivibrio sp.]